MGLPARWSWYRRRIQEGRTSSPALPPTPRAPTIAIAASGCVSPVVASVRTIVHRFSTRCFLLGTNVANVSVARRTRIRQGFADRIARQPYGGWQTISTIGCTRMTTRPRISRTRQMAGWTVESANSWRIAWSRVALYGATDASSAVHAREPRMTVACWRIRTAADPEFGASSDVCRAG
jgi:hypothetical protein